MTADPTNAQWSSSSVEFCGGTHVKRTSQIQKFVIMEEQAISKGVRRVVAVTMQQSHQTLSLASQISSKLTEISKLSMNNGLEHSLKSFGVMLDSAGIPYLSKLEIRTRFQAIKKKFDDADKLRKSHECKTSVARITEQMSLISLETPSSAVCGVVVNLVDACGNAEALNMSGRLATYT